MPKKPFLRRLFKRNKFNPKNTSYNKEVSDLQKHALTNPVSMSEAENDIETSYTDNTSTHIVIDTSNDNIDTSNTEINNVVNADNNADTNNISQITIQENIIDTSTTESIDTSNASDTSNTTTDTSSNIIDTSIIDNNTSNEIIDTSHVEQTSIDNNAINVIVLRNNTPELQLLTYNKNEFINTSNVENIDTNNIHSTDTSMTYDTSNNNISQVEIQENIIDTSTTENIDTSNASDTNNIITDTDSNVTHTSLHIETDTSNNPIDTSTIDNNTSNDNIDTNKIHSTDTSIIDDTSNTEQTSTINNTSYTENTNQVFHASYETYPNKKHEVLVDIKKSKPTKKNKKDKKSFREIITDNVNKVLGFFENIFIKEPLVYSLSYENNIACKLDDNMLVTRDGNLCVAMKLEGVSYASITQAREIDLAQARSQFFNTLDSSIEVNIFCKKELIDLEMRECKINNKYAEAIIKKWEYGTKAYKINYYLIFSTKTKRITGFFESKKRALTEERAESENKTQSYKNKVAKLNSVIENAKGSLAEFNPTLLKSDDLLNLYATYSNMSETKLKYSYDLITDCYMTSDVEFKKDYMIFYTNTNETIYARFLSVKAYETESVSSIIPTGILRENADYYFLFSCEALNKQEAINKIKRVRTFAVELVQNNLDSLVQLMQSDRENIIKISLSILLISKESLNDLNEKTNSMKALLERQSLSIVKETLNQKPLFFSFFPSRSNLNARKRHQTSGVLSTLCTFENDILGNKANRWGNQPITTFKHLSGSPFFFNFHDSDSNSSVGHTLVIGGTGYGKTTLMQFLILNLFKYDINIFAMDKLRGMCAFTEFVGGEYHDLEKGGFRLNPFSLQDTDENNMFLRMWLCEMASINDTEHDLKDIVSSTLKQLRDTEKSNLIISLKDFYDSMRLPNDTTADIKAQFKEYRNSLFDNKECALNFNKQLSMLNMDAILKNPKLSALSAMYLFHKIKNISKNANKGFFIWIDELRDYLNDKNMRDKIIEMIVEIRKINGVITMGLQNLDFLDEISNANTFIDNMSNYIIFPTKDEKTLEQLYSKLSLSGSEINFLSQASKNKRQVLFKQKEIGSAILDVNLSRLGKDYLRVFSSSSDDVNELLELKKQYPSEWRDRYLKGLKPNLY